MQLDPTVQNVGVGGMLFLCALWLILKFKPWKNGNASSKASGEQSIDFWKSEIRKTVQEGIKEEFKSRNEDIRRIVREELDRRSRR